MKASFHLLYGIIIGMLIIACTGSDSDTASTTNTASNQGNVASATNTTTPTSSIADQKQFKEIRTVWFSYREDHTGNVTYGFHDSRPDEKTFIASSTGSADDIRKAGWTIIDMEYPLERSNAHYLIGK